MTESESSAMEAATEELAREASPLPSGPERAHWGAVWSLGIGVASLSTSEMLPVSLLTPIARDLRVSEGVAGQAVTASAMVAVLTSVLLAPLIGTLDRRRLLLVLSFLQIVCNLVVALAPSMGAVLGARMILGLSVGGFWGMSSALALRLAPRSQVPQALSIIFGGGSVAAIVASPLGAWLGGLLGWRGVFYGAAALSLVAFATQVRTLPPMPVTQRTRISGLGHVLRVPMIALGMAGVLLLFGGRQTLVTYLRPFLETVTGLGYSGVSLVLLTLGVGVFIGNTFFAAPLLNWNLHLTMASLAVVMGGLGALLLLAGDTALVAGSIVLVWGMATGVTTVGWTTWLTRVVPDKAESGGGLLVAAIQIAIMTGSALGGVAIDQFGVRAPAALSAAILLVGAVHCWFVLADHGRPFRS